MSAEQTTEGRNRFDASQGPRILGPRDGEYVDLQSLGVRFMVGSAESGGGFSLVEHPIPPRGLRTPLHRHTHDDEYRLVFELFAAGRFVAFFPARRRQPQLALGTQQCPVDPRRAPVVVLAGCTVTVVRSDEVSRGIPEFQAPRCWTLESM